MGVPVIPSGPRAHLPDARLNVRRAWLSLALLPVSLVFALFFGDWLLTLQGYESSVDRVVPVTVALLAGVPAVLVMVAPGVAAIFFGMRAIRNGLPSGRVPAMLGAALTIGLIVLNVVGFAFSR